MPDTYRYVTVPDAHSIHARYWSKQSILAVPDTRRYVSIPGFSVRTRIRVDFPDVDFLDFHVSASCLRPRRFRSILQIHTDTMRYTTIQGDTAKYTPIRGDTRQLQNAHRYEAATHDNFRIHTDTWRYTTIRCDTSKYTPLHDNTMRYFRIHNNT